MGNSGNPDMMSNSDVAETLSSLATLLTVSATASKHNDHVCFSSLLRNSLLNSLKRSANQSIDICPILLTLGRNRGLQGQFTNNIINIDQSVNNRLLKTF